VAALNRFGLAEPPVDPGIQELRPQDVPLLRLSRQSEIDDALDAISRYPGRSVWLPSSLEYVLVTPWRNRRSVGYVGELASIRNTEALIRAAGERASELGDTLTLMIDLDEERPRGFYRRAGLHPIERIVTYDLRRGNQRLAQASKTRFIRAEAGREDHLQALMAIDRQSFPWLWWNTPEEFAHYEAQPGVEIYLGIRDGRAVSYCGFTIFLGWAHLDRIAVSPEHQGSGVGRDTLAFVIEELFRVPVDRIGLSTQELNERSRRLYEASGFRRSPGYDYCLYGMAHREPALSLVEHAPVI
jgi:ribosomal protein S18 acetylase RimI-like enzyme